MIAIEEQEWTEEQTTCETSVAVMGSNRMLIEAMKAVKKDGGVVEDILKKADFMLLMEKFCQ